MSALNMRPKTARRLTVIIGGAMLLVALGAGGWAYNQHVKEQKIQTARAEGVAAFKAGDYPVAMFRLGYYLMYRQEDPEALMDYGLARMRVEDPTYKHVFEPIAVFRRYLQVKPNDFDAQHLLLDLYLQADYKNEAIQLGGDILRNHPNDPAALRGVAKAYAGFNERDKYAKALDLAKQLNKIAPNDAQGWMLTVQLMWQLRKPGEEAQKRQEIRDLADGMLEKNLDDPRVEMLDGFAYLYTADPSNPLDMKTAQQWLVNAANSSTINDPEFITELANLLDRIWMFEKAEKLMEAAADRSKDPKVMRLLIQRLWQNQQYAKVIEKIGGLDPWSPMSNTHLLAYLALSYYETSPRQADRGNLLVDALSTRTGDEAALAWAAVLDTRFRKPGLDPRKARDAYSAAMVRDPGNPVIRYLLADTYAKLGESELAIQSYGEAINRAPSWVQPRLMRVEALLKAGRTQEATDEALAAYNASPSYAAAIAVVVTQFAQLQPNDDATAQGILRNVENIQKNIPGEPETLPIYLTLLCRTGQKELAAQKLQEAMSSGRKYSPETFLRLSRVAADQKLVPGADQKLRDLAGQVGGATPQIAMADAMAELAAGRPQDGLKKLQDAAAKDAVKTNIPIWHVAVAQFREQIKDDGAHDAWVAVGDANPDNLLVQKAILESAPSAWKDRAFIDRTIDRLHKLTGDEGVDWRIARARWLLGTDTDKDAAAAAKMLMDIVQTSARLPEPRRLLAVALRKINQPEAAAKHLKDAFELNPRSIEIASLYLQLLLELGRYDEAISVMDKAVDLPGANDGFRLAVAQEYENLGRHDRAAAIAEKLPDTLYPAKQQLLAAIYRRQGNTAEAGKIYAQMVARNAPPPDPEFVRQGADFFASRGDPDLAKKLLDLLSSPNAKLAPGTRELVLARHEEHWGDRKQALADYQAAAKAAPNNPDVWRYITGFNMRQGDFNAAVASADEGLKIAPKDRALLALKSHASILQGQGGRAGLQALIDYLAERPTDDAAVQTLRAVDQARRSPTTIPAAIRALTDVKNRFPRFLPAYTILMQSYIAAGDTKAAADVGETALRLFPNDAEPARLLASIYHNTGQWDKLLTAAQQWRARSSGDPEVADAAVADAYMLNGNATAAAELLKPYAAKITRDPDANYTLAVPYARALILTGHRDEADKLFSGLLARSPRWRARWMDLASTTANPRTLPQAREWLRRLDPLIPAGADDEQLALSKAWYDLSGVTLPKERDPECLQTALAKSTAVSQHHPQQIPPLLVVSSCYQDMGQIDKAEDAYRQILKLKPVESYFILNNLAYLLATQGPAKAAEAQDLIEKAVKERPDDVNVLDTRGRVYFSMGKYDVARASFERARTLQPTNLSALVGLGRTWVKLGKMAQANEVLTQIDRLLDGSNIPAWLKDELDQLRESLGRNTKLSETDNSR